MASTRLADMTASGGVADAHLFYSWESAGVERKVAASQLRSYMFAAAVVLGVAGATSTPALSTTGAWFSGGTGTTTKPHLLIEPTGATSTNWNTAGTGLGINAASGATGDIINAQINGVVRFAIHSSLQRITLSDGYHIDYSTSFPEWRFLRSGVATSIQASTIVSTVQVFAPILTTSSSINYHISATRLGLGSTTPIQFGSTTAANSSIDTTLSRQGPGILQFGGAAADASGAWLARAGTLTGGTVTASDPPLSITQTWNNAGTTFTGISALITATAAADASKLIDIKLAADFYSVFEIKKNGFIGMGQLNTALEVNSPSGYIGFMEQRSGGPAFGAPFAAAITSGSKLQVRAGGVFSWSNSTFDGATTSDTFISRAAAANVRFGANADAASPVAQTLSVQNVLTGTSNAAGADWTHQASLSTGTQAGGSHIFKTGFAGKGAASTTITVTIASPAVVTWTSHAFQPGQPVVFTTDGALPTGITAGTTYYVQQTALSANTFRISATPGGTDINTSGSQSGTHTGTTSATVQNPAMDRLIIASGGGITIPSNSRVSAPSIYVVGTPYGGGTATTTKPHVLIEASGTTSTNWNTGGTLFGLNANGNPSNIRPWDFQIGGFSIFYADRDGQIYWGGNPPSMQTAANVWQMICGGVESAAFSNGGLLISPTRALNWANTSFPSLYQNTAGLSLFADANETLAQRRGTNAQTFRIYNTFTDASNYERANLSWLSNVFDIATANAGTGSARGITINPADRAVANGGVKFFSADTRAQFQIYSDGNDPVIGATGSAAQHFFVRGGASKWLNFRADTIPNLQIAGSGLAQGIRFTFGAISAGSAASYFGLNYGTSMMWSDVTAAAPNTAFTIMGPARVGIDEVRDAMVFMGGTAWTGATTFTTGGIFALRAGAAATGGDPGGFYLQSGHRSFGASQTSTVTFSSPLVNWTSHGLVPGQIVRFTTTGTLPTGLSLATNYFVSATGLTANAFQVSLTWGNDGVAGTSATMSGGSGTHTATCATTTTTGLSVVSANVMTIGPSGLIGSLATSAVTINQTWNTSGIAAGITADFTDIASNAASRIIDLKVGGATKFSILKGGQPIMFPPASAAALANNGELTIEATANTTLTFKYRGSDGTTRSGTVTLA